MKKLIALCLCAALAALLLNVFFAYDISPTRRFWERCAKTSDKWAEALRENGDPCYIFAGGSETRTGIDPYILFSDYGIKAINAGNTAGYTPVCNFESAIGYIRPGDTLIFSFPDYDLSESPGKLGLQFAFKRNGFHLFADGAIKPGYKNVRKLLIGDTGTYVSFLTKLLFFKGSIYSYEDLTSIHSSGWMELHTHIVQAPRDLKVGNTSLPHLSESSIQGLNTIREICVLRQCRLLLCVHPALSHENDRALYALKILDATRRGYKVIKDESLGCYPNADLFADTSHHMNRKGVHLYMNVLGKALREQSFWTEKELVEILAQYGIDSDGKYFLNSN